MSNAKARRIRRKVLAAKFEGAAAKKAGVTECPYPSQHVKFLPWHMGYMRGQHETEGTDKQPE